MSEKIQMASATDMTEAEFREALAQFGDWVARFREQVDTLPVMARVKPGEITSALPQQPPAEGEPVEKWLADLDRIIVPGMTHWNHPGFLSYFANTGSGPSILGELICAAFNVNGMLWKTSPACTELEQVVLRWYGTALGLPADWFGMMTDTASTSTLMALAAAREVALPGVRDEGLCGQPQLVLYCSEEAHSSVDKAGMVLGIGRKGVRHIPTDNEYRMVPVELERAIREDRAAGRLPFAVVATVGTTSATAVDPVPAIAEICQRQKLWLHVDTAYAGSAAIAPELRWALAGCEHADSLTSNPHKWFFTAMDCSALYTRRPEDLRRAFSLVPEYLRTDAGDVTNLMDYTFQLGRRFRALKLWFVFRYFGTNGIASIIRDHVAMAQEFASWVDAHPRMERIAPVPFSVICFRVLPPGVRSASGPFDEKVEVEIERLNAAILQKVNSHGVVFVTHTKLKGRYCIRVAIGNLNTRLHHLRRAFDLISSNV